MGVVGFSRSREWSPYGLRHTPGLCGYCHAVLPGATSLGRCLVVEGGVESAYVVAGDPVLNVPAGAGTFRPGLDADFGLDRGEERFGGSAVKAGAGAAGARTDLQAT